MAESERQQPTSNGLLWPTLEICVFSCGASGTEMDTLSIYVIFLPTIHMSSPQTLPSPTVNSTDIFSGAKFIL